MKYYPAEIAMKKFDRKMMGYDPEQVESFLTAIATQMDSFIKERETLKAAIREKEIELMSFREREDLLQSTMTKATQSADRIKEDAERQSKIIIREANEKADKITLDARESLRKIYQDIAQLRKSKMQFEANLKAMAQAHLSLLEQGETFMPRMSIPDLDME